MKIVIAGPFPFPSGSASAARIRNYALGFKECGVEVYVLAMWPMPFDAERPLHTALSHAGVQYEKTAALNLDPAPGPVSKLKWFLSSYGSVVPTFLRLRQLIDRGECDLFLSCGRSAAVQWPLVRLCHSRGIPTILDVVELAEYFRGTGGRLNPVYWDWQLGANRMPRAFDMVSAITHALKDKYLDLGCKQVIVIPSIEGWENLPAIEALPARDEFRLICVGGLIDRDAPDVLLDAMQILASRSSPVRLDVVGRFERFAEGRQRVARIQADPLLRQCVNLVGEVSDEELSLRLREADGLVLLRRNAKTEIAAFPTRLVEYLRQGRPVFVSDVGDIRSYLQHERDAILLSADDPLQVAEAIEAVASSPDRGYALGVRGRERGAQCFDRKTHAQRLLDMVNAQDAMALSDHRERR